MDWQLTLTCAAIILAGAHLLMRARRTLLGKQSGGCGGGCGCVKPKSQPALLAPEQLVLRRRPPPSSAS